MGHKIKPFSLYLPSRTLPNPARPLFFDQTFKNIRRTREIVRILLKYGFEDLVVNTPLHRFVPMRRRALWLDQERPVFETTRWERVRMATEELGATFIKGAQVLSNRPDMLPEDLIAQLQRLQSDVKPFPFEQVVETIETELGRPLEAIFEYFHETPIGAASIGQVHQARLLDGQEVVVKIQRPGVRNLVTTDLDILKVIVRQGEAYFESLGITNLMDFVEAFEKTMLKEMDYTVESRNIRQFREYYREAKSFYVPKAFEEYTTKKVMVIEFVGGCKITDVVKLREWGLAPENLAERGLELYLTQIFEHGFFHADPHPGNIIIGQDGTINLIDFGMVGKLTPRDKRSFAGAMISMAQLDPKRMAEYLVQLSTESRIRNMRDLESDLSELIEEYAVLDVKESNFAELAQRLQAIIYKYRMRVPGGVFIILRALAILEGIGQSIHPNFNTYAFIKPYGRKLILEEFSPKNLAFKLFTLASNTVSFANSFPNDARDIMGKLRKGDLRIEIAPKDYEPFLNRTDRMASRLSLALIFSALTVGGAIVVAAFAINPQAAVPMIAYIGWGLAGFFLLLLWRNMGKTK